LKELHSIVRFLGISDGNMEEGSFRCDANVSVRPVGQEAFGTRTEVKNMNSFRNVERALDHEIERQIAVLSDGGEVVQETRLWDDAASRTLSMRGKEEAHDYRYFPDPDLLPLVIDEEWIERVRAGLPELARDKRARYVEQMGLPETDAEVLTGSPEVSAYFEAVAAEYPHAKEAANWVAGQVLAWVRSAGSFPSACPVTPKRLAQLLSLQKEGVISGKIAKGVFDLMLEDGRPPREIVEEKGLVQVSDEGAIEAVVDEVLAANPKEVEAYKGGKTKLLGFFVGQVMQRTKGKANPKTANELLRKKLQNA
ncbi:MAG: Asp-tRNA(Asn)/Glu-tRNA(Gln) amidotransferase subunit GatB, partial [Deltaproteobacteria bacterium]|nr:Asp-tRNA(Asn)/Glu-tRNA(Gln) amidotransferase subunit GatB [Deltaproteobacteria bacterium]